MQDHYKVLGLAPEAKPEEIKRAYREMTKKFHPDRNAARPQWATAQMKRVIEANRVLSNPGLRATYDLRHAAARVVEAKPERRARHRREGDSLRAQSERVLHDLLGGEAARAVSNYEKLAAANGFDLSHHMDERDWIDCKFLLAEQYARLGNYDRALTLYEDLYHSETAHRRHRFFKTEVGERMLYICIHNLGAESKPEVAAGHYLRALGLELTKPRRAFLHKKLSEACLAMGDTESARRHLGIAFQLKPDLKGASKICRKLHVTQEALAGQAP
jgi:curved DNA-binding protein CbpA